MIFIAMWTNLAESYRVKRLEWFFASGLFLLGAVLAAPVDTFGSSPSYNVMRLWAEEETWAMWLLIGGGLRLIILFVNGVWWRSALLRSITAFYSLFFWATLALGILTANPFSTGALYGLIFFFEFSNMTLAGKEAGVLEKIAIARSGIPHTGWRGFCRYILGIAGSPNGDHR